MDVAPVALDTHLVPGLTLPKLPGLPGPGTPGIDPRKVLGPPAPDSFAGRADMFTVKTAQRFRTPAGNEWAERLARDGQIKVWLDFAKQMRGASSGAVQGWLQTALLAADVAATAATTYLVKRAYDRPRPFVTDPSIVPLGPVPHSPSYPSGHASAAFAAARVIAKLDPALSSAAYDLATQIAVSRVYAGVHYPSDVVTGALLGTGVAEAMLRTVGRVLPGPHKVAAAA
jgi:membrane-associated phospholipid phosphatase